MKPTESSVAAIRLGDLRGLAVHMVVLHRASAPTTTTLCRFLKGRLRLEGAGNHQAAAARRTRLGGMLVRHVQLETTDTPKEKRKGQSGHPSAGPRRTAMGTGSHAADYTILGYGHQEPTMLNDTEKKQLLGRLRRVEGQAAGLIRMVEADKYCIDILQQMAAVQGALAQASKLLVRSHLESCVVEAFKSPDEDSQERVISELVDLFARLNRAGPTK